MGQKINQNILRLGQTKEWQSKYIEKKSNELFSYTFNDLEIKKFICKFFEQNGLLVDNCKISQSENFLHIFISYFTLPKTKQFIDQDNNNKKIKILLKKKKSKMFLKKKIAIKKNILNYNFYNLNNFKLPISISKHYFLYKKIKRLSIINSYKKYKNIKTYKNINQSNTNLFVKKIFQNIYLFLDKKTTVKLSLKQLNSDNNIIKTFSEKKKNLIKTNLLKLRKFQKNDFFKIGLTLLYNCVINNKSSELIAKYIAFNFKKFKRHKFFINFLNSTLKIFINKNFSNIKRIKILIKGRFNGVSRAKKKFLLIGVPPILTLNSNIDYFESTSFTPNGTFGIKVWTYY